MRAFDILTDVTDELVESIGATVEQIVLEHLSTDLLAMRPEVQLLERRDKEPALDEPRYACGRFDV